jgi:TetR/AcrR family transcriptional regulator, transcriptional repressor for nem operon
MGRTSDAREKLMEAAWELIWAGSYGGTSVDQICERAGVRKGSFYHFFKSKVELAKGALDDAWKKHLAEMDHIFSPQHSPLDRLRKVCEYIVVDQRKCAAKHGRVLGCPVHSLGAEVSPWEGDLQVKIKEAIAKHQRYFESALRDAAAEGLVPAQPNPAIRAKIVSAYVEGVLMHARILNDLKVLDEMARGVHLIARAALPA